MNHTKNYKRYLIENVEMCKRTRQRRERGDMPDEIYCSTNERMSSSSDDASDADLSNSESESDTSSCSTVADTQYIDEISDLSHDEMRDSEIDSFEELHDDRNTLYSEESNDQILENDENDDVESFEELNDECNTDSRKDFLYPGANITSEESEMLIMSYILRHGVSDKGLSDLLKLIDCHLPHSVLPSKYVFLKKFPDTMVSQVKHYYCFSCSDLLDFNDFETCICEECGETNQKKYLDENDCFFYSIPLKPQLQFMLSNPKVISLLRNENSCSDVTTGKIYKSHLENSDFCKHDISVQFNVDGAKVFKSAQKSLWPIQVVVNELPFSIRNDMSMLCGVWFGKGSPRMDTYLKPFISELKDLHRDGIEVTLPDEDVTCIKVHCILCTVDSVARPKLQNMVQFNGKYGCPYCYNKGTSFVKQHSRSWIYLSYIAKERTEEEVIRDATKATVLKKPVRGVKGPSALCLLPLFNIVTSMAPDYLHSVLLGVVRMLCFAWFDSTNHNKPWYLGRQMAEINDKFSQLKPPTEITRTPSSLEKRKMWKASEWRSFLLYFSLPLLNNHLPRKYLKHWLLLVFAFQVLLKEKISNFDISNSRDALFKFVRSLKDLYGAEYLTFNVHLLLHFPNYVESWGSPWSSSTFVFEQGNGVLVNLVRGTQSVPQQICKYYNLYKYLQRAGSLIFSNSPSKIKHVFKSFMGDYYLVANANSMLHQNLTVFGVPNIIKANISQQIAIKACIKQNFNEKVTIYERFVWKGVLYHSIFYQRLKKRNNSCVQISNSLFLEIIYLVKVSLINGDDIFVVMGNNLEVQNETLCRNDNISSSFIKIVSQGDLVCCLLDKLIAKCVHMEINDVQYISCLVNSLERD